MNLSYRLRWCHIGDEGAAALAVALETNTTVTEIK